MSVAAAASERSTTVSGIGTPHHGNCITVLGLLHYCSWAVGLLNNPLGNKNRLLGLIAITKSKNVPLEQPRFVTLARSASCVGGRDKDCSSAYDSNIQSICFLYIMVGFGRGLTLFSSGRLPTTRARINQKRSVGKGNTAASSHHQPYHCCSRV